MLYLGTFGDVLQYPGYSVEGSVAEVASGCQHVLTLDAMIGLALGVLHSGGVHF